jgi:hypothetical protein
VEGENFSLIPQLRYGTRQPKLSHGFELPIANVVAYLLRMQIERLAKVAVKKDLPMSQLIDIIGVGVILIFLFLLG